MMLTTSAPRRPGSGPRPCVPCLGRRGVGSRDLVTLTGGRTETRRLRGSLLHQFELRFRLMQSEQSLFSGGLYRGTTRLGAKAAIVGRLMGELTGRPSWLCPVERKSLPCEGPRRREPWGARGSLRVRGRGQGTAQRPGERASGVRHRARDPGLDARDLGRGTVPLGGHCRAGHTPGNCLFSA